MNSVAGALAPIFDPAGFVSSQLGHVQPHPLYPTEQVLSLQLGHGSPSRVLEIL